MADGHKCGWQNNRDIAIERKSVFGDFLAIRVDSNVRRGGGGSTPIKVAMYIYLLFAFGS